MTVVNELRSNGAVNAATRLVLLGALAVAALWSVLDGIGATIGIVSAVLRGEIATTLATETPVTGVQPEGPLTSAVYDSAAVVVTGAPGGIQLLALVSDGAAVVTRLALGFAFVLLILAVLRRAPFSSRTALQTTLCGAIAMITALFALGLGVLANWMTADFLSMSGAGKWPITADVDPTLIPLGFALMIVGLLIDHGTRLQHATHGLV